MPSRMCYPEFAEQNFRATFVEQSRNQNQCEPGRKREGCGLPAREFRQHRKKQITLPENNQKIEMVVGAAGAQFRGYRIP
jgi:hypothetical protein